MPTGAKGTSPLGKVLASSGGEVAGDRSGVFGVNHSDAGAGRSGRRMVITAAGAALVMTAAACSGLGGTKPPPAPQVTITPGSGALGVRPNAPVTVTVAHGKLRNVVVQDVGDPLSGQLSLKGTVWTSRAPPPRSAPGTRRSSRPARSGC